MHEERVLKFPLSEKMFHNINMVTWMILALSGILIYFRIVDDPAAELLMDIHMVVAVIFTFNFFGFVVINADRFFLMLRNLLIWDKDTLAWFKNFGGYPRMLFNIPFGPEKVAPQGRFNAGQKGTYLFFIFMIFALIVTGWLLYAAAPVLGKTTVKYMFYFHVWGSIIATLVALGGHLPLALVNFEDFKAMFRFGPGDVPLSDAVHHAPKWVKEDLIKVSRVEEDLTQKHGH
ncbi:cytochrome b/b6 domain-containing protein [Wolinella succinogenes]|uniref:cytochrome b/b6 domain-containing protein n=1 Tax=Wolinella succinogenes TaxID=844 RepID=UPI002408FFAA|nr:cytochrome b/b6 domain-containing protein [Wolinella succinogenes]